MANYMAIKELDINNGPGLRTTFWFSGCHFQCEECHNKPAWSFKAGKEITDDVIRYTSSSLKEVYGEKINLSILGGEPLAPENIYTCACIIAKVRYDYNYNRNIWLWTGYTKRELEDIIALYGDNESELTLEESRYVHSLIYILEDLDVLIDGRYIKDLKIEDKCCYKGSSNQAVIKLR